MRLMTDAPNAFGLSVRTPDDNYTGPTAHGSADTSTRSPDYGRTHAFATTPGDLSHLLSEEELNALGSRACNEWTRDKGELGSWHAEVQDAIESATQQDRKYEGDGANVRFPLLTQAALNWASRAYPAIVKGDEIFGVKKVGEAPQPPPPLPAPPPNSPPQLMQQYEAATQEHAQNFQAQQQAWQALDARRKRVATYLNYQLFYASGGDWEDDEDVMLNQLPVIGCAFKKVWWDRQERRVRSELVNAMRLTVPLNTRNFERAPRATQDFDIYPYEIEEGVRAGEYRDVDLTPNSDDRQAPRLWIEQHCMEDLDGDGLAEPYVVTVDTLTQQVMRVEAGYGPADISITNSEESLSKRSRESDATVGFPSGGAGSDEMERAVVGAGNGLLQGSSSGTILSVGSITRWTPYVPFSFMPDINGRIYALGFGKLMASLGDVVDTIINQMLDAGTAQVKGGGFIASGLRLQGSGQSSTLRWRHGEYKVVNVTGAALKDAIWERPLPGPSSVLRDLLNLLLDAAKDVGNIKDILTGDTPATAPVGTTLAVANQALQPFSAIFKRVYRGTYREGIKAYECIARYAVHDLEAEKDYIRITGAQPGDFARDFAGPSSDVIPVADPNVVTQQQAMARAQVGLGLLGNPAVAPMINAHKIAEDVLTAAQYDDPDSYLQTPAPDPKAQAEVSDIQAGAQLKQAQAAQARAAAIRDTGQGTHLTELARQAAVGHETPQQRREHEGLVEVAKAAGLKALEPPQMEDGDAPGSDHG